MINATTTSPSGNSQPTIPNNQDLQSIVQPTSTDITPPAPPSSAGSKSNDTPPKKSKRKLSIGMIIGGIVLVLLIAGSGVGLYLSQQSQDIRHQAMEGGQAPISPSGQEGSSTQGGSCDYSCSNGHPSTPDISGENCGYSRATDVCRGKGYTGSPDGKYYRCQLCQLSQSARDRLSSEERSKRQAQNWYACPGEETNADASGCDYSCLCGNADQNTCYEKGPSHDAGVFNGNYSCKHTQVDVILNGGHVYNCRSTDNRDWSECAPPPQEEPPACQSVTVNGSASAGVGTTKTFAEGDEVTYVTKGTGSVTKLSLCFHATYLASGRTWSQDWKCYTSAPNASGAYTVKLKFSDIRDAIVSMNAGYTATDINSKGLQYAGGAESPDGVQCDGGDKWTDGGAKWNNGNPQCSYNHTGCAGKVAKASKIAGPACKALTVTGGTLANGVRQVSSPTTSMTFKLEGTPPTGGSIAGDQICFYPNYLANKNDYTLGWYCLPGGSSVSPDPYTVTRTYAEIKAGIRARDPQSNKITDAQIDSDGIRYGGNVHAPQGTFCDGGNKWNNAVGDNLYEACTYNHDCAGNIKYVEEKIPEKIACGLDGCTKDADCESGLKCVSGSASGKKYCARNTPYNLSACAQNPSVANCCQDQEVIKCNSNCSNNSQCTEALGNGYECNAGKCRLSENPTDNQCKPLAPLICNAQCTPGPVGDAQCQKTNSNYICSSEGASGGRCRHKSWPEQPNCKKPDPVCTSITMSPNKPQINSEVTFTCALVNGVDNYEFRITEPGAKTPTSLAVLNKNISIPYKITKPGSFLAECRLCPTDSKGNPVCLSWPK